MEILHGIYDLPKQKICLWKEGRKKLSKPEKLFTWQESGESKIILPTHNSNPIPSPMMAREYNIELPDKTKLEPHSVKCIYVDVPNLKGIAETEKLLFAQDLLFWIKMLDVISEILDHHLYIPSIKNNQAVWITYHPDVENLSTNMPDICSYIDGKRHNKLYILQLFDSTVSNILTLRKNLILP